MAAVFEKILSRRPSKKELQSLVQLFEAELFAFKKSPEKAEKLLRTGRFPQNPSLEKSESAALMLVASAVFNLDAAMTKG